MRPPLEVTINGPRGDEWERVCGTRKFPVATWNPVTARVQGTPRKVHMVLLGALPLETLDAMILHLATKFELTVDVTRRDVMTHGIPILAEDCTVVLNDPQRWVG